MYHRLSQYAEDTVLVYADPTELSDTPALHLHYCLDCGFEFTTDDGDHCPACGSDEVQRER